MSIRVTQFDSQGYRTAKPARKRTEARFEVRETKAVNHINTNTITQVEPAETRSTSKTTTSIKTSEKTIKITKASSHVASASIRHGCKDLVSSTLHYVGKPKNTTIIKDSNGRLLSSNTLIGTEKYAMADCSDIPGIPKDVKDDQSSQKKQRNAIQLIPASLKPLQREKNNNIRVSLSTNVQSVWTEPGSNIIVSTQATCKQPQSQRVKGQSGSKILRNADRDPSSDRCDAQSEPKSRTDHENSEYDDLLADSQQTGQLSKVIVRTKGQKTENNSTECLSIGMSNLDKQEQFSRQTRYKHSSLGSTSDGASYTYTDSASDHLELYSSSDGDVCSPGLPRSNTSQTKRRKRVKRKGSSKSIDSCMYGEDNTSDGESATDTLSRVHDRRSRKRDDETSLNSSTRQASRSKPSLSGITTHTIKGAQFRSSSLTSVSSVESGKLASATSSPLLTPRGPTLVKKIQIQSFSSSYTDFKKDNKENQPKRRASSEDHFSARVRERSLVPDHPRSSKNNLERSSNRTATPPSKGRPFALRSKPFQLKRSSSRESPCTSENESLGTPFSARTKDDPFGTVPVFTDKPSHNIPRVSPEPTPSSLPSNLSGDLHYPGLDDEVFSGNLNASDSNQECKRDELPVFKSDLDNTPVSLIETVQTSINSVSDPVSIPSSSASESSQWMEHSYNSRSYDDDSFGAYGYKSLSIVNECDEIDFTQPPNNTEHIHTRHHKINNNTNKTFASSAEKWNLSIEKDNNQRCNSFDPPPASPVRRPSYIKAQQNFDDFTQSLFHSFDDQVTKPPLMETTFSGTEDEEFVEDYDPKEVLRSFSGSNLDEANALTNVQKGGDLITFEDENAMEEVSAHEGTGEPVVKKRKKKIARPKIPTIFSVDGKELGLEEELSNEEENECVNQQYTVVRAREETMGQDSMDEKCDTISLSKDEEFDMNESSKRNTLVAIDSDDGSTPKARYSPEPDSYPSKDMRTHDENKNFSLPEITTDLYIDNEECISDKSNIPLKKVDTIFDLSGDESPTRGFQDYQNNRSIESLRSQGDSPSNSEMSLDKYSMPTSGFSEIGGEMTDSGDIPIQEKCKLVPAKNEAWRSQSDPSGRTNGAGAPLSETIAEAAELTSYRTSNSAPNLITEKIKKEEALLAKRLERPTVSRTKSSPSSLPKPMVDIEKARSYSVGSKDDSHAKLSTDSIYQQDVLKSSQKVNSAPTTPTQSRKQLYPGTLTAEKAQMKLAKLAVAAMEPIYETPLTEVVRPLPEPVKLERKVGTSPIPVIEQSERPPATGLQDSQPAMDKLQPKAKSKHDIKRHVVQNLLETEQSYVQNLQYIISAYYKPLKKPENSHIVDAAQVDEMFYQISDILLCHEFFLEQLESRVNDWHDKQKIGDILVASFTKCFLMDAYSAFISHFLHARAAVRIATMSRPGFQRFIEQCCREHREKYTLQDLMIIPVQRIPRYVLILKDMIKHTSQDHPDYGSLLLALGEIKTLADRMNRGEKEVNEAEIEADRLRDIEASIEGITDLVLPSRRFLRKDLAAEVRGSITKKDRCLFLFTDLLVCASVKRKPNALRRGSLSLFSGQSGSEFNKHKLLWKMSLENVELVKSSPEMQRRNSLEKQLEKLENDMSVLSQISSLTDSLNVGHQTLDSSIREMMNEVSRQIAEKQIPMHQSLNTKIELQAQTEDGLENFVFLFLDVEIKNTWEAYFENAKQKLAYAKDTFPPEFQYPIPITKTRSGMQFTCSSPSQVPHMLDRGNHCGSGDVWVCNSDGYVGQVCILSMGEQIQPVASLSVCSSRILCISPVPGTKLVGLENAEHDSKSDTRSLGNNSDTSSYKVPSSQKLSPGYSSDDDRNAQTIMAFDSSSDDEEGNDGFINNKFGRNSPIFDGRLSPEGSSLGTIDGEMDSSNDDDSEIDESEDEENKVKVSHRHIKRRDSALTTGSATSAEDKLSLSDIVPYDTEEGSTVWLGTEDGSIFVYPVNDANQKKNKMKIQHQASVQCILYVDNQVFVSLGNGDLCIYRRQPGSAWEVGAPITLQVGASAPVSCMTAVHGRLWCGCQCNAIIYNTTTLKIETQFNCSLDKDRSVYRMVSTGMGVWLSLQSSAVIRLFHATRYECLADVDVAPPVHKMLAGSDAIIRQHKAACLRVTSLLTCKDLLWIGTSAGVVLTLPLPTITATTSSLRNSPSATASYHGHTGHVRFLTAVEVPKEGTQENTNDKEPTTPLNNSTPNSGHPLTPGPTGNNIARDILIISGGDGYEDFKTSSTSESAGRDDSTNHLLIWRV